MEPSPAPKIILFLVSENHIRKYAFDGTLLQKVERVSEGVTLPYSSAVINANLVVTINFWRPTMVYDLESLAHNSETEHTCHDVDPITKEVVSFKEDRLVITAPDGSSRELLVGVCPVPIHQLRAVSDHKGRAEVFIASPTQINAYNRLNGRLLRRYHIGVLCFVVTDIYLIVWWNQIRLNRF